MGTTIAIVLVIVGVLAVGFFRESRRSGAVDRWCRTNGFAVVPPAEQDRERLAAWAERFRPRSVSQWGSVLRADRAGADTVLAEHRETPISGPERWHTLAVVRVPGLQLDGVRITRAPSEAVRAVTDAVVSPAREVRDRLGIEVTPPPIVHPVGGGQWAVDLTDGEGLPFWSSAPQAAAIDAWPHDAERAAVDDYVLVRVPGLIDAGRLDDLLSASDAARDLFAQAAAGLRKAR